MSFLHFRGRITGRRDTTGNDRRVAGLASEHRRQTAQSEEQGSHASPPMGRVPKSDGRGA